jgi:hypothetical protein
MSHGETKIETSYTLVEKWVPQGTSIDAKIRYASLSPDIGTF